jgi:molybdate transport system ATP-binding protein
MFQDYLLFPHLSAVENVAFGLRAKGTDKKQARDRATQALARLGLEGALTSARPAAMSGLRRRGRAAARTGPDLGR